VEAERLAQAVERARKLGGTTKEAEREREQILRVARESPKVLHQIVCRKRDRVVLTPPEQICWFQVEDGVVKAHTAAETFTVNYQLGELEASLPADVFFRARREVLVNLTRIREIRPYFKSGFLLVMPDAAATEIVVSERQARSLRQRIPGL
jgi:DNA-binding LytR/AlgR family response regulator